MADLSRYYRPSGVVTPGGLGGTALVTLIGAAAVSWLFVRGTYSVTGDWAQIIFLFLYAGGLFVVYRVAVRVGKIQSRVVDVFWSLITSAVGLYFSLIFRVAKLNSDLGLVFGPRALWGGLEEAYAQGIEVYIRFSRVLEPGLHVETDPLPTVLIEVAFVTAILFLGGIAASREEFFCRECDVYLEESAKVRDLLMPHDLTAFVAGLEAGDPLPVLSLSRAPDGPDVLRVSLYRCTGAHRGILTVVGVHRRVGKRGLRAARPHERTLIRGLYLDPEASDRVEAHLKGLNEA